MSALAKVWIQRSDFQSGADDFSVSSADEVISAWLAYDWDAERARAKKLEAEGEDDCPSGMGIVRNDGAILHLFGNPSDGLAGFFHPPRKGWGPFKSTPKPVELSSINDTNREGAVRAFLSEQDQQLLELLKGQS